MKGLWDGWWDVPDTTTTPLDATTFVLAAEWLDEVCASVEDWGCGGKRAQRFFKRASYRGVDGSRSPADVIADLREYHSDVDGILLRHVLEHNVEWSRILANALSSARKRIALVIFTPFSTDVTKQLRWNPMRPDGSEVGVPDLSFAPFDLLEVIGPGWTVRESSHTTDTVYGGETVMYLERRPVPPTFYASTVARDPEAFKSSLD